jgi:hypothetical protein
MSTVVASAYPYYFETSCEGSSAHMKDAVKTVFPRLKSVAKAISTPKPYE